MTDPADFYFSVDESVVKKEREKARELRDSAWWKRKRSNGICYYCGGSFPPASLTMDHLIPLSRGGRSNKENIVACCKECNNQKKNKLPTEWTEYLNRLKHSGKEGEIESKPDESDSGSISEESGQAH